MELIRKYTKYLYLIAGLTLLYFLTRIYDIMSLPIFTDEAIYTRWSQIARWDANWRFISLTDGKQPSFVWLDMIFMRVISDPLLAGRLVSVAAGFFSAIGLYFLSSELFRNKKIGLITVAAYIIFPFALVYDRMALYESLVNMFMIWALYLEVLLVRRIRLDVALLLGMTIGGAVLTKSNGFFAVPFLAASLLIFEWKQKMLKNHLLKWIGLSLIAIIIAFLMYSVLRLSPFFHIISEKNEVFIYPFKEWLQHPTRFFVGNLRGLFDWLITYYTWPLLLSVPLAFVFPTKNIKEEFRRIIDIFGGFFIVVAGFFAFGKMIQNKDFFPEALPFLFVLLFAACIIRGFLGKSESLREKLLLIIWLAAPFIYLAFFGKALYPRYILLSSIFFLPLSAYSVYYLWEYFQKKVFIFLVFILFLFLLPLYSSYSILTNFKNSPIPFLDLEQYINSWPAGGGINEVISYLDNQSKKQKIYVVAIGDFGSLPKYATEIYLGDNKNIERGDPGIYPIPEQIPPDLLIAAKTKPVYIFFSNQREFDEKLIAWPLKKIFEYYKGTGSSYTKLYQVIP